MEPDISAASPPPHSDVLIVGAGMSGMACAARLQAKGLQTRVLEAHGLVGGCAGYFRRRGFSFDVGATTLVDFEPEGVGGQFLRAIGMKPLDGELLPGYQAWLPDRTVTLHRDKRAWHHERLRAFGDTPNHRTFWTLLDTLAQVFWEASRRGIKMPIRSVGDAVHAVRLLPTRSWPLARYLTWTMADALDAHGLQDDKPLRALMGMLIQDTVHSTVEAAPLINSALGVTIRGAGLTRAQGGTFGFWRALLKRYNDLGGDVRVGHRVERLERGSSGFVAHTRRGTFTAPQVISTLPIWNSANLGVPKVKRALQPWMQRDEPNLGGAVVLFLGVPEHEVAERKLTHHQILVDYDLPMEDGNNMFISISAPGDTDSAPAGHRAVMISTHCDLEPWENLNDAQYQSKKDAICQRLLDHARRVYPNLGRNAVFLKTGTPRSYARFTSRYRGAVGGVRLELGNSNQRAVPFDIGVPGFWQGGDTTWPGLGTVACILSSHHISKNVARAHRG